MFRRQSLSERELLEFGRLIGNPGIYAETHWLSTYDEIIILSNMRGQDGEPLGGLANKGLTWHTDQSYYARPVTGCFLYGVEVPANGGGTRWASLYRAYETLSDSMKNTIDALWARLVTVRAPAPSPKRTITTTVRAVLARRRTSNIRW